MADRRYWLSGGERCSDLCLQKLAFKKVAHAA